MSKKVNEMFEPTICNETASYGDLKETRIKNLGPSQAEIARLITSGSEQDFSQPTNIKKLTYICEIITKICLDCGTDTKTVDLFIAALAKAHTHPKLTQRIHVNKYPTFNDLADMTRDFDSEMVTYQQSRQSVKPSTCSYCGRRGHSERDCYKKRNDTPQQQPVALKQSSLPVKCNYCNRRGHTEDTCKKKDNNSKQKVNPIGSKAPNPNTKE